MSILTRATYYSEVKTNWKQGRKSWKSSLLISLKDQLSDCMRESLLSCKTQLRKITLYARSKRHPRMAQLHPLRQLATLAIWPSKDSQESLNFPCQTKSNKDVSQQLSIEAHLSIHGGERYRRTYCSLAVQRVWIWSTMETPRLHLEHIRARNQTIYHWVGSSNLRLRGGHRTLMSSRRVWSM